MTIEFMLGLLIVTDIVLVLALLFLIRMANREMKRKPPELDEKVFSEFRELIEASRRSTDHLLQALNKVEEVGHNLDEKEERLKALVEKSDLRLENQKPEVSSRGKKYDNVITMSGQGLAEKEIADILNLTEGEVSLILDLHRKKNEDSHSRNSVK